LIGSSIIIIIPTKENCDASQFLGFPLETATRRSFERSNENCDASQFLGFPLETATRRSFLLYFYNVSFMLHFPPRRKPEAGSRKPEAGSRKPEAGSRKPEAVASESRSLAQWQGFGFPLAKGKAARGSLAASLAA